MHFYLYCALLADQNSDVLKGLYIQGDSLPDQQTLWGDSRHEAKHY